MNPKYQPREGKTRGIQFIKTKFGLDFIYTKNVYSDTTTVNTSTTQRTYNIINNKLWEDTGSDLINYGMWNFISINIANLSII